MADRIIKSGKIDPVPFSLDGQYLPSQSDKEEKPDFETLLQQEYQRGLAEGRAYASELVKQQVELFKKAIEDFSKEKEEAFKAAERQMVDLSLQIAKLIISKEVSIDKNIVASIVKEVLDSVKDKSKISLFINPIDEDVIKKHLPKFMAGIEAEVELIVDDSIEPGGAIVQTPSGRIDALIDTQIEELKKRLL